MLDMLHAAPLVRFPTSPTVSDIASFFPPLEQSIKHPNWHGTPRYYNNHQVHVDCCHRFYMLARVNITWSLIFFQPAKNVFQIKINDNFAFPFTINLRWHLQPHGTATSEILFLRIFFIWRCNYSCLQITTSLDVLIRREPVSFGEQFRDRCVPSFTRERFVFWCCHKLDSVELNGNKSPGLGQ